MNAKKTAFLFFALGWLIVVARCHGRNIAAAPAGTAGGSEDLYAYRWNLAGLNGKPVRSGGKDTAYLLFTPGKVNTVAGSGGCNRLRGTFELQGAASIRFSLLATTRMACPGDGESLFLQALSQADTWRIVNRQLQLNRGSTLLAVLQGVAAGTQQ